MCLNVFFRQRKIENMGGWRPTRHNYRYGMCLNVFFCQRKIENMGRWRPTKHKYRYAMCLNVVLLNTITDIGRI
jgi:hypothetical protein